MALRSTIIIVIDFGDTNAGTRCWVYIPSVLKNGTTAPVVVYLHGFMAIVPPIYAGQDKAPGAPGLYCDFSRV